MVGRKKLICFLPFDYPNSSQLSGLPHPLLQIRFKLHLAGARLQNPSRECSAWSTEAVITSDEPQLLRFGHTTPWSPAFTLPIPLKLNFWTRFPSKVSVV